MSKLGLNYVHSRADFFRALDEAILETSQKITANPGWTTLEIFMQQLMFMRATTSGGRKPKFEEREKVNIGTIARREMESVSDLEWYDYGDKLSDLGYYYQLWQTDAGLQRLEQTGCDKAPYWHDLSDEPDTPELW
jgi:hypothetical protein